MVFLFYGGRLGVTAISKGVPIFWRRQNYKLAFARNIFSVIVALGEAKSSSEKLKGAILPWHASEVVYGLSSIKCSRGIVLPGAGALRLCDI